VVACDSLTAWVLGSRRRHFCAPQSEHSLTLGASSVMHGSRAVPTSMGDYANRRDMKARLRMYLKKR
jgi:hypothetical protein